MPEPSPRPWRDAALYCAAALVILWVRRPDAFANPQLWAEDGMVFFLDDLRLGTEAWVTPYAGYLHAFPRLTAWLGGKVDPCLVPGLYTGCWIALTLAVVARTFSNRLRLPAKGLLGLAIVAVPHTGEVYMNITNVQWITAFLLFQLSLMEDPRIARQAVCDALALVGAGLSGPFCILLWPLFVWRYWHTRSRASLAFLAAMTLCAAIQGGSILQHRTESIGGDFAITQGLGMILRRTLGSLFLGPSTAQAFSPEVFVAAGGLALLAWLISSFRRSPLRTARLACWFAVVAIIVASSAKVRPDVWEPTNMHDGDRYFFVPKVLLLWLLILELGNPSRRFVGTCLLALTFAMNGSTFCLPALPDLRWHDYCGRIRNNEAVVVPINPPGWQIPVPGKNP